MFDCCPLSQHFCKPTTHSKEGFNRSHHQRHACVVHWLCHTTGNTPLREVYQAGQVGAAAVGVPGQLQQGPLGTLWDSWVDWCPESNRHSACVSCAGNSSGGAVEGPVAVRETGAVCSIPVAGHAWIEKLIHSVVLLKDDQTAWQVLCCPPPLLPLPGACRGTNS